MRTLPLLLLLIAGLTACGDSGKGVHSPQAGEFSAVSSGTSVGDRDFLSRVMVAPSTTEYMARREVSFFVHEENGVVEELTYLEEVTSNGHGLFDVQIEDLLEPKVSPERIEVFRLIQRGREEFFYNHRDFRVRDLELFLANYEIALRDDDVRVLDRECSVLTVSPRSGEQTYYELYVDNETSLVLVQREYDSEDRLVSEVEFVELTLGTPGSEFIARAQARAGRNWRPAIPRDGLLNLNVHAPTFPPAGFQLLDQRIITDPLGDEWYELIYGDGVEQIFVLFALSPPPSTMVLAKEEVLLYRHGRWTVVEGHVRSERIIVLGKASSDDLILMLESCL